MSAQIIPIDARLNAAWADYIARKDAAERSGLIVDGIAAGKAWRRWIDLFLTEDQRRVIGGNR